MSKAKRTKKKKKADRIKKIMEANARKIATTSPKAKKIKATKSPQKSKVVKILPKVPPRMKKVGAKKKKEKPFEPTRSAQVKDLEKILGYDPFPDIDKLVVFKRNPLLNPPKRIKLVIVSSALIFFEKEILASNFEFFMVDGIVIGKSLRNYHLVLKGKQQEITYRTEKKPLYSLYAQMKGKFYYLDKINHEYPEWMLRKTEKGKKLINCVHGYINTKVKEN